MDALGNPQHDFVERLAPTGGRQRYEQAWIMKLRRTPQFRELVRRLVKGDPVWGIARWLMTCPERGELSGCSFETLRKYLTALAFRVRENADWSERLDLGDFEKGAVHAHLQAKVSAAVKNLPDPAGFDDLRKTVAEEVQRLDTMTMLRYCFVIQNQRLNELLELEKRAKLPLPQGNKIIKVLVQIAVEIGKLELGEARQRASFDFGASVNLRVPSPHGQSEDQQIEQMGEADRERWREAAARVRDLLREAGVSFPIAADQEGLEGKQSSVD